MDTLLVQLLLGVTFPRVATEDDLTEVVDHGNVIDEVAAAGEEAGCHEDGEVEGGSAGPPTSGQRAN